MEKNKILPARRTYNCQRDPKVKVLSDEEVIFGKASKTRTVSRAAPTKETFHGRPPIRTNFNPVLPSFSKKTSSKEFERKPPLQRRNTADATFHSRLPTNVNPALVGVSRRNASGTVIAHGQIRTNLNSAVPRISEIHSQKQVKTPALPPLGSRATGQIHTHASPVLQSTSIHSFALPRKRKSASLISQPHEMSTSTDALYDPGDFRTNKEKKFEIDKLAGSADCDEIQPPSKIARLDDDKCVDSGVVRTHNEKKIEMGNLAGSVPLLDPQFKISGIEEPSSSLRCPINLDKENICEPTSEDCWKGTFEIIGHDHASSVTLVYDSIQARLPTKAAQRACEISKIMPERLQFKVLQRKEAWPKPFKQDPLDTDDIGLYFFPSDIERPKQRFNILMNFVNLHDFAMRTQIGDVELLLFASMQLAEDLRSEIGEEPYLWGIFRHIKHRKPIQGVPGLLLPHSAGGGGGDGDHGAAMMGDKFHSNISYVDNTEADMEINIIGGIEIGRVDNPIPRI